MAYDGSVPSENNDVRGVGNDLAQMQENFSLLSGVAVSGVEGLVNVTGVATTSGEFLEYNGSAWAVRSALVITASLSGLTDTAVSGAVSGEFLEWDGTDWVPGAVSLTLSGLTDTAVSGAVSGLALVYDGTDWVHQDRFVQLAGDDMTGPLGMGNNRISGVATPSLSQDAANKAYVDTLSGLSISGAVALSGLTDTYDGGAVTPASGEFLRWDSSLWVPSGAALDELSDVSAPSPVSGEVLVYDGANWVPGTAAPTTDWLMVRPTTAVVSGGAGFVAGDPLPFDSAVSGNLGSITFDTVSGIVSLAAGGWYKLEFGIQMRWSSTGSTDRALIKCADFLGGDAKLLGAGGSDQTQGYIYPMHTSAPVGTERMPEMNNVSMILNATSGMQLRLMVDTQVGTIDRFESRSHWFIQRLS